MLPPHDKATARRRLDVRKVLPLLLLAAVVFLISTLALHGGMTEDSDDSASKLLPVRKSAKLVRKLSSAVSAAKATATATAAAARTVADTAATSAKTTVSTVATTAGRAASSSRQALRNMVARGASSRERALRECKDQHENCVKWSSTGECKNNPGFMR